MPARPSQPSSSSPGPHHSLTGEVVVIRRAHFNAAHRLENTERSARWNRAKFGACNHPNWHGHNYLLEVSVAGTPDPSTGYVIDLGVLKAIVQREIIDLCDHRNLNLDVGFLQGIIPSAENLVIAFWHQLEPHIPSGRLHCVRLWETERNRAEFYGPANPAT